MRLALALCHVGLCRASGDAHRVLAWGVITVNGQQTKDPQHIVKDGGVITRHHAQSHTVQDEFIYRSPLLPLLQWKSAMKIINLPVYDIVVHVDGCAGRITSSLTDISKEPDLEYNAMVDGIESIILACACAGIDIESPAFLVAIETSVDACMNKYDEPGCDHAPDWKSIAIDPDIQSDEGFPVIDVSCRKCGRSGSFIGTDTVAADIQWE